jgi:hypothetical protein
MLPFILFLLHLLSLHILLLFFISSLFFCLVSSIYFSFMPPFPHCSILFLLSLSSRFPCPSRIHTVGFAEGKAAGSGSWTDTQTTGTCPSPQHSGVGSATRPSATPGELNCSLFLLPLPFPALQPFPSPPAPCPHRRLPTLNVKKLVSVGPWPRILTVSSPRRQGIIVEA